MPDLISRVQNLTLEVHTPAKIVINERNGTIVLGGDVKLTPVSVIHGNLSIEVVTSYDVAIVPTGGVGGTDEKGRGRCGGQTAACARSRKPDCSCKRCSGPDHAAG